MKKKVLGAIFVFILVMVAFSVTAFAAQKTELPVRMVQTSFGSYSPVVTIKSFEVTNVHAVSESRNRIEFDIDYIDSSSGDLYMVVHCYDDRGYMVGTVDYNSYIDYIDVPSATATIEISMEKPAWGNNESYLYRNFVNVYAPDGRILTITDLQVPLYESVGWSKGVTMYAPVDGKFTRTIKVPPYEVEAHEKVGWYTAEGAVFYLAKQLCDEYKAGKDYEAIFQVVEDALKYLTGTKYEAELYTIRTEAMNLWRNYCGKPMGLIQYKIGENSIGTPEVSLWFRNLSYKKIVAYRVKFTCYDIFGNVEDSYYSSYIDDDADMDIAEQGGGTWTLYGADSVHTVKNIRVTEVVYADGTKWYGK